MDIRSLACFIAVAEDLHFRRAAERLNLTQPALSQRIRALEEQVGTALFERDRRRVSLTPAGQAFLAPARAAVASVGEAKSAALRAARGEFGRLRLGFTVIAFYGSLPDTVWRFRQRYPQVEVELQEMNSPRLERALDNGELDLGVLHPPLSTPSLVVHPLAELPMRLALPANHPLAGNEIVPLEALRDEPLLCAPRSVGPSIFDRLIGLLCAQGFSPRIALEVTPMTTLVGLVAAGAGLGFVTAGIAAIPRPGVVFRETTPPPPTLPLAAAWREPSLIPSAKRFLALVDESGR
ncbi:LysR family transcriptional regulator [Halotalea alkalilenta]|uniref:LysR family transcriptional regulator n=1 Tax=Halotalea alkalilenta TaxID=376489 RepID=A0A172YBD2_9GAMM|nr:LysR family transcriptional regulator [Halotalea alkalilenta]ANF56527.1 LysR family transcriptional regulator [Halotalea alkalilenta]